MILDKNNITYFIKSKLEKNLDNPIFLIIIGYLGIILMAITKIDFNIFFLLFVISIYVLFFSFGFYFDNIINKFNINIIPNKNIYFYILIILLFFLFIFLIFGIFITEHSILLGIFYSIIIFTIIYFSKYYYKYNNKLLDFLFILGIILYTILIVKYGTIPILNYNVRNIIVSEPLRLISSGCLFFSSFKNKYYFIIAFILLFLTGYKLSVFILVVSYLIYKYRLKQINIKKFFIYLFGALILVIIMFPIILSSSNQTWNSIFDIIIHRAYLDLYIFNKIIYYPEYLWGKITFYPMGESNIEKIIFNSDYKSNLASTLFGPLFLDFKWYGLIFSFVLGAMSKIIYNGDNKIYSIYCALLLGMCDVGINYGFITTLLFICASTIVIKLYNKDNKDNSKNN